MRADAGRGPELHGIRFAPSPTGRFHVGNLRTAWVSHHLARCLSQPWIVRFEDIDQPRVIDGAQEQQLHDLRSLGLEPAQILVQSRFRARHWELFDRAVGSGQVYPCSCSRKEVQQALAQIASAPHAPVASYSGACRPIGPGGAPGRPAAPPGAPAETLAWRFRMPDSSGRQDFIIARSAPGLDARGLPPARSFVPAYHWACAIDDADGAYQWIVRAADLAQAVEPQRAIQAWLLAEQGLPLQLASVFHTALVVQDDGHRLEKRTPGVTLHELLQRADAAFILKLLGESFRDDDLPVSVLPGQILYESARSLTLSRLGLASS